MAILKLLNKYEKIHLSIFLKGKVHIREDVALPLICLSLNQHKKHITNLWIMF